MAIFSAAVDGFIYFGGSGDYGGFEPPFSNTYKKRKIAIPFNAVLPSILSEHTTLSFPQCKEALRQRLLPSRASPLFAGYDLSRRRFRREARLWWLLTSAFRFQKLC